MKLKALIIEDEEDCRILLQSLLNEYCEGVEVIGVADQIAKAVSAIQVHQPDLVFLDIELPNEDGFALFKYIPNPNFQIIFTTAYSQYAIKAFKFSAIDYLLKPIDLVELRSAVAAVRERKTFQVTQKKLEVLKENLNSLEQRLVLPTQNGFSFIELKNIVYCEAVGNYTNFILLEDKKILVSKTLKIYTDLLEEFSFFRISRAHLVNINHIAKYGRQKSPTITMQNGITLSVSVKRREHFFKKITPMI